MKQDQERIIKRFSGKLSLLAIIYIKIKSVIINVSH